MNAYVCATYALLHPDDFPVFDSLDSQSLFFLFFLLQWTSGGVFLISYVVLCMGLNLVLCDVPSCPEVPGCCVRIPSVCFST